MFRKLISFVLLIVVISSFCVTGFAAQVSVDGTVGEIESFTIDGVMFVPFRDLFSRLGADVTWDPVSRTGRAGIGDFKLDVALGERFFVVDGERYNIDVEPRIINDKIFVPIRAAAEAFRCTVWYDAASGTVYITSGERPWSLGDIFRGIISAKGWDGVHVALQVGEPVDVNGVQCASVNAYSEYGWVGSFAVSYDLAYVYELVNGWYQPMYITR